jgi:hypothetical protein
MSSGQDTINYFYHPYSIASWCSGRIALDLRSESQQDYFDTIQDTGIACLDTPGTLPCVSLSTLVHISISFDGM